MRVLLSRSATSAGLAAIAGTAIAVVAVGCATVPPVESPVSVLSAYWGGRRHDQRPRRRLCTDLHRPDRPRRPAGDVL
jgi:hypothetical protein